MKKYVLVMTAALLLSLQAACCPSHHRGPGGPGSPGCPQHKNCDCTCRQQPDCPKKADCPKQTDCPKQQPDCPQHRQQEPPPPAK